MRSQPVDQASVQMEARGLCLEIFGQEADKLLGLHAPHRRERQGSVLRLLPIAERDPSL